MKTIKFKKMRIKANDRAKSVWINKFLNIIIVMGMFPTFTNVCIVVWVFPNLIRVYENLRFFITIIIPMQCCHTTNQCHDFYIRVIILAIYVRMIVFVCVLPKCLSICIVVIVFFFSNFIRDFVNSMVFLNSCVRRYLHKS